MDAEYENAALVRGRWYGLISEDSATVVQCGKRGAVFTELGVCSGGDVCLPGGYF